MGSIHAMFAQKNKNAPLDGSTLNKPTGEGQARFLLWLSVALLAVAPAVFSLAHVYTQYRAAISAASHDLDRTSRLTADWVDYSFRAIRESSRDVEIWIRNDGMTRTEDLRYYSQDPHLITNLRARSRALSRVSELFLVDERGTLIATSSALPAGVREKALDETAVTRILQAFATGQTGRDLMVIPADVQGRRRLYAGYRIASEAGSTVGSIVANIDPGWLEAMFSDVDSGERLSITLDRREPDGSLTRIASSRHVHEAGEGLRLREVPIPGLGLVLTTSLEEGEVLTSWRRETLGIASFVVLWEGILFVGFGLAKRLGRTVEHAQRARALAETAARRAVEEARTARIRADEKAVEAIFDNDSIGLAEIAEPEKRFTRVNRRFCEISGRSAEELLGGLGPQDVYLSEDIPIFLSAMRELEERGSAEMTVRYRHADGMPMWAHVGLKISVRHADGSPAHIITVVQDITDVKRATEEVQAREKLLRLSMQSGHVGVFWCDKGESRLNLSEELCEILGLPSTLRVASYSYLGRHVSREDRARIRAGVASAIAGREAEQAHAFRFTRPSDGVARLIEARVRYDYASDGACVTTGVMIDVTDIREVEALFRLSLNIGRIGTFHIDFVREQVQCDDTTRALYGLPADDRPIPLDEWLGVIVEDDREALETSIAHDVACGVVEMRRDYRICRADDGSFRHFNARMHLGYGAGGQLVGATGVIIDLTERYEAEAKIAHLARHDVLTGLANRMVLRERVDAAIAGLPSGGAFALLMIDLDHFKTVNDTLGHPAGDALLQAVTGRLVGAVRESDLPARLGGDEFAVLVSFMDDPKAVAVTIADRIIGLMATPFQIGEHLVSIGSSIGIALASGDHLDTDEVFKAADLALYRAKAEGRNCWRLFSAEMDADLRRRRIEELDLRRAVEDDEFELVYQPIIGLRTGQTLAVEAQPRWQHPERGIVAAEAFLGLAEDIGVMPILGARMLVRACVDAASWPGELRLAIGVTPSQIIDPGFIASVEEALSISGLQPDRLEIEIGEASLAPSARDVSPILAELSKLGVRLCIEGIGSRQSILGLISKYPFDQIKLDRRVVDTLDDPVNAAIVRAVSGLCDGLRLGCTVGGVETEQQLRILANEGFQTAHGRLFSRPLRGLELGAFLSREGDEDEMPGEEARGERRLGG